MSGNGEEGQIRKMCPFLGRWCIGDACACWVMITQQKVILGVPQMIQGGTCAVPALCMIMSSRPQAPPIAQKPIRLPFNVGS